MHRTEIRNENLKTYYLQRPTTFLLFGMSQKPIHIVALSLPLVAGPALIFKVEENGEMGWPAGQGTGCTRWVRWAPVINWQLVHSNGQLLPPAQWIYHLPCYWYRAGHTRLLLRQSHTDLGPTNGASHSSAKNCVKTSFWLDKGQTFLYFNLSLEQ